MGLDLNSWLTYKGMTLEIIVWSMFLGIIIGAIITLYNKSVLGAFVRKLLDTGSTTPESAKTLEETGFANNICVKFSLQIKSTYRKIIRTTAINDRIPDPSSADTAQTPENGIKKKRKRGDRQKLSELKFFIPEEMIMRADSFYSNKGTSLLIVIMTAALFLTVAILSIMIIPNLVQMLKNFVEYVSPQG